MKGITSVRFGMDKGALSNHGSWGSLLSIFVVWLILWFCKYDLLQGGLEEQRRVAKTTKQDSNFFPPLNVVYVPKDVFSIRV